MSPANTAMGRPMARLDLVESGKRLRRFRLIANPLGSAPQAGVHPVGFGAKC
jgi:hypothetical protein